MKYLLISAFSKLKESCNFSFIRNSYLKKNKKTNKNIPGDFNEMYFIDHLDFLHYQANKKLGSVKAHTDTNSQRDTWTGKKIRKHTHRK